MKHMWMAATIALAAALFFVAGAHSQTSPLSAALRPLLLDIQRSVPITLTLDIPLPSGVTATVEVPATVDLAVTINLSSPLSPTLTIGAEAVPMRSADPDPSLSGIDDEGIPYTIENESVAKLLSWTAGDAFMGSGFQMVGELRNTSEESTLDNYEIRVVVTLYDAEGKILDAGIGFATLGKIAPGQTTPFTVASMTNFSDVASYAIQIQVSGE